MLPTIISPSISNLDFSGVPEKRRIVKKFAGKLGALQKTYYICTANTWCHSSVGRAKD